MRIKEICDFVSRGTTPEYVDDSPFKVMNQATFSKGWLDESNIRFTSKPVYDAQITKGDLLMASTGGGVLGKVFYFDKDDACFYADSHVSILRNTKRKHLMKFLYYYFLIRYEEINATMVKGSTNQTELQRNYLLAYEINMPSLSVQQKIVDYLDEKTSAIDTRVELLEKKKDAYTRLKKAMINRAVTRGLDEPVKLKDSDVEWIGMIPEHWEVKRFKEVAKTIKGKQCDYFDEKEKNMEVVLTVETLRQDTPAFFNYGIVEDKSQLCDENDMVVIWDGAGVGEFLKAKKGILSSTIAKIDVDEKKVLKPYLWQWRYQIEYRLKSVPTGMGIPHLNPTLLNNYAIPVPPLSEQQSIAAYLDEKCAKIDAAIANIDKQIDALKRLKRSLINEVISGKRMIE